MTVQEYMGGRIEGAARMLGHFIKCTDDEKRDWVPAVEGAAGLRSALDQLAECILVNRMIAALLRGETPQPFAPGQITRPFTEVDEGIEQLEASGNELADAVRGLSDADLEKEFTTRRGPMPGYNLIEMPYRNMVYHGGQINLLQLLYGDTEFRVPQPPQK